MHYEVRFPNRIPIMRSTRMVEPGEMLILSVMGDGETVTQLYNCKVLQYDNGLLTVEQSAKQFIYNVRSPSFVKADEQK